MKPPHIVIVGGGISGLAVAHRLVELHQPLHIPLSITVLEAHDRFGGIIQTQRRDGLLLESGPDAFITEKPWAVNLCERLGLAGELMQTQPTSRRSFIVRHGQLVPVPEGWDLIAPSRLTTLARAPLLSWLGKARMACEPFVSARHDERDESVGNFVRRRFGQEALERVGQPMIGGIYTADPEQLSVLAAMPRLREMERHYGSVTQALRANQRQTNGATASASGPRYGLFMTLRGGMERLVDALLQRLAGVTLRKKTAVTDVTPGQMWTITLADGTSLKADALCLALPTHHAASLVNSFSPALAQRLAEISYESVATVNMAFHRADLSHPLDGFGVVVPAVEHRPLVGCTFSSVKFADRAPEHTVLVRAFVGGALHRAQWQLDDAAMQQMVREELRALLGVRGEPLVTSIHRFSHAMPQYHVGHLERVEAIEQAITQYPELYLTGNGYRGLGIPDCIHQAEVSAERMMVRMMALRGAVYAGA